MPSATRPRGRAWAALSKAVILRDGGWCWLCGRQGADTADHVIPFSRGGVGMDITNLRAAHRSCNSRRGNRLVLVSRSSRRW